MEESFDLSCSVSGLSLESQSSCAPTQTVFSLECDERFSFSSLSSTSETHISGTESMDISSLVEESSENDNNTGNETSEVQNSQEEFQNGVPPQGRRFDVCKFFLTFPQCDVSPGSALDRILGKNFGSEVKECVVASEKHKDGTPHLHCYLVFKSRLRAVVRPDFFDFVGGKHGNYQKMKKPIACLRYVVKGGVYVSSPGFDPKLKILASSKKKSVTSNDIASSILARVVTLPEVIMMNPGFFMLNARKIKSFMQDADDLRSAKRVLLSIVNVASEELDPCSLQVYDFLVSIKSTFTRASKHLRIQGPTALGKSTLLFELKRFFRIYYVVYDTDWMCEWDDSKYDLIVLDEFKSQKKLTWLNAFTDGLGFPCKRKGMSAISHSVKTPVVILSNYSWDDSYHNAFACGSESLAAAKRRFVTLELCAQEPLFSLIDAVRVTISLADQDI